MSNYFDDNMWEKSPFNPKNVLENATKEWVGKYWKKSCEQLKKEINECREDIQRRVRDLAKNPKKLKLRGSSMTIQSHLKELETQKTRMSKLLLAFKMKGCGDRIRIPQDCHVWAKYESKKKKLIDDDLRKLSISNGYAKSVAIAAAVGVGVAVIVSLFASAPVAAPAALCLAIYTKVVADE